MSARKRARAMARRSATGVVSTLSPVAISPQSRDDLSSRARAAVKGELVLYGEIGKKKDVRAAKVREALSAAGGKDVTIRVNSDGGEINEGTAICTAIRAYKGKTTCIVDGIAASMASVIACACDEVVMTEGSYMMIHSPHGGVEGGAAAGRDRAQDAAHEVGGARAHERRAHVLGDAHPVAHQQRRVAEHVRVHLLVDDAAHARARAPGPDEGVVDVAALQRHQLDALSVEREPGGEVGGALTHGEGAPAHR